MTQPNPPIIILSDGEKLALLRAALNDLRPKLATLPERQHIDQVLWLTRSL